MNGLIEGRIVHYVLELDGLAGDPPEYAAIVSRNYSGQAIFSAQDMDANETDGLVRLHVFTENTVIVKDYVPYSADKLPNTWHWIEPV